jgi:hypothetical protein
VTAISPGSRGDRVAVPEHADLDLDPVDELLDEHLLVVGEGERDRGLELAASWALEIPIDEPSRAGLTNTG